MKVATLPRRVDFPVTADTIAAAKLARDAERAAAGIVCDEEGRIIFELKQVSRSA